MLSPDWKAMFLPPGNPPPPPPIQPSWSTGYTGHMSTPSPPQQKHSHLYYLFFFAPYWPNRSQTIFQPAAFVSKQLYLLGYGLFSLALSLLCYRLSLSFGSKHMGHMIVDPVQVLETRIPCIGLNVDQRRSFFFFLIYGKNKKL